MAYTVLARRYRSTSFGQIIGQEHVAQTLKNAIISGRVAHAYLFTGTRGVGKTSTARILARALNAPDTIEDAPKPDDGYEYPETDVQERMANAIMRGEDLNVIEIDGASNRGVDEARQLINNAGLAPTGQARYKIYIIDEVHMLTREAFNALLKTMEEPPEHVKFILCTTEAQKVPATILSRCQQFDFRNIPIQQIAAHLKDVLDKEEVTADEQAVYQVARLGNGSMRDALSLLDRLIATGDSPLSVQTLENMLGLPPSERVISLLDAIADKNVPESLQQIDSLINTGVGQEQLIDVIIGRLRQLLLISSCGVDSELVELSPEARQDALKQAERFDTAGIVHMIALCESLQRNLKSSNTQRALIDATIVRMTMASQMADVTALIQALKAEAQKKKVDDPVIKILEAYLASFQSNTSQSTPQPTANPVDASSPPIWQQVLANTESQPAFAWIHKLQLIDFKNDTATLAPKPGQREIYRFAASPRNQEKLSEFFSQAHGSKVQIILNSPESQASGGGQSGTIAQAHGGNPTGAEGEAKASLTEIVTQGPLMKKVMEAFPDARIVSIEEVDEEVPEPASTGENEATDEQENE